MPDSEALSKRVKKPITGIAAGAGTLAAATLGAAAGWIVYSNLAVEHNALLPKAIQATRKTFSSHRAGELSYYTDRGAAGRPLVGIHSVNAAASAYEMSPLFEWYRHRRPVYALDLPGYGFSNRMRRRYTPELFAEAILEFLESEVGEAVDVVALSLSSEFAARAALDQPQWFHSLALISPSGFSQQQQATSSQQASYEGRSWELYRFLSFPLWARPLYDLITTRASIDFFLRKSFYGPVAPGMVDYAYATAHQPGAENVPLYFISGALFTPDIFEQVYANLHVPTLMIYDQDPFVKFDRLPELISRNTDWRAVRIHPTRGLPHFEKPEATTEALNRFWERIG